MYKSILVKLKKYLLSITTILFILASMILGFVPYPAYATATVNETVASEGTLTDGVYNGGGTFANLNSNDGDTSKIDLSSTAENNHLYHMTAWGGTPASINSVTITYSAKTTDVVAAKMYPLTQVNGVTYPASQLTLITSYSTVTQVYAVDPSTGLAWASAAAINATQFGFHTGNPSGAGYVSVSYMLITISYEAVGAPTVTTQAVTAIAPTTATGNGTVVSDGGSVILARGTCLDTAINPDLTKTVNTAAGYTGVFTTSLAALTKGTLYHVRAYATNAIGTSYGSDVTFTTIADPTISTVAASIITTATVQLNAQVTSDGSAAGTENCTVTFVYHATAPPYANYAAILGAGGTEVAATGYYNTGQFAYVSITGLAASTLYSFAVKTTNSTATIAYGSVLTFTTLTGIPAPTNVTAVSSGTSISVLWTKGAAGDQSVVCCSTSAYPTTVTLAATVYSGIGNSVQLTGLLEGTTYYISVWDMTGGAYSATYATALATTTTAAQNSAATIPTNDYSTPMQWFQAPDYTRMSGFPLYDVINWGADTFKIPRATDWFTLSIIVCMAMGIFIYRMSTNIPAAAGSIAITMFFCSLMGLMEMWLLTPFILIGIGAWVQGNRA